MDARDQHWLGGLGKSWKLRSALGAAPAMPPQSSSLVAAESNSSADDGIIADDNDLIDETAAEIDAWAVCRLKSPKATNICQLARVVCGSRSCREFCR